MTKQKNYKKTQIACYLGFITQAISANFTPLLFLTFKSTYGISLEKIALIPFVFIHGTVSIARVIYGKMSEKLDLTKTMLMCGVMCACCYLVAFLSPVPILALAGDLGATVSPALVGSLAELSGVNLKNGLLVAAVFPVVLVIGLILPGKT